MIPRKPLKGENACKVDHDESREQDLLWEQDIDNETVKEAKLAKTRTLVTTVSHEVPVCRKRLDLIRVHASGCRAQVAILRISVIC